MSKKSEWIIEIRDGIPHLTDRKELIRCSWREERRMSVLIKGMEMPNHCGECGIEWCEKWKRLIVAGMPSAKARPEDCPLVPVPPHGALMDRDDFFATCPELVDGYKHITDDLVVIPAEEGE